MFVWRASTLLDCIERYEPVTRQGLGRIADAWATPQRAETLARVYPGLRKISVDYAVMEPASRDPAVRVAAVPMPLRWLDVGSWTSFGHVCPRDEGGNALGGGRHVLLRASRNVVASSDPGHVIAVLGCDDLVVIHTPEATLVCHASEAEAVKELHARVVERLGEELA